MPLAFSLNVLALFGAWENSERESPGGRKTSRGERERELNESSFAKQRSLSPQNGVNIFLLVSSFDFLQSRMLSKKWNSQRIICLRISFQNVFGAHFLHKITNINRFTDGCTDKSTHALRFIYIAHTHTNQKDLIHPPTQSSTHTNRHASMHRHAQRIQVVKPLASTHRGRAERLRFQ